MKNRANKMNPQGVWDWVNLHVATCFLTSFLPSKLKPHLPKKGPLKFLSIPSMTGAGTIGAVWGLLLFWILPSSVANSLWVVIFGSLVSVYASQRAEKILNSHDDSRIIVDEVVGMWVALWGFPNELGIHFIIAFILFRGFDIWKGPWGRFLEKLPGGWGVTLDDIGAGILANVGTHLILRCLL